MKVETIRIDLIKLSENTRKTNGKEDIAELKSSIESVGLIASLLEAQVSQNFCDPSKHEWEDEYYGHRCKICNQFLPFGCEPWRIDDTDEDRPSWDDDWNDEEL